MMDDPQNKRSAEAPQLIPPHGGFRDLQSYKMSEIVYDATVVFCDRFISKRSRTHDQMVQAAQSEKQNIAEGSMGLRHLQEVRTQAYWGGAGKFRGASAGFSGLSAPEGLGPLGQGSPESTTG